jgi:hypothetical protein
VRINCGRTRERERERETEVSLGQFAGLGRRQLRQTTLVQSAIRNANTIERVTEKRRGQTKTNKVVFIVDRILNSGELSEKCKK